VGTWIKRASESEMTRTRPLAQTSIISTGTHFSFRGTDSAFTKLRQSTLRAQLVAMVSAENLNLDVLELIFAHLSGHDLTSVSLVSRTFFAGAIPTLYRNITYRLKEAKAYDTVRLFDIETRALIDHFG
jgi:hypothetical protein